MFYRVLDPIKYVLQVFERLKKHSWKSVCQESSKQLCFCERWRVAYQKNIKHRLLIKRWFLLGFKITARDVLSMSLIGQWAYDLLLSF